jgi:hypothetical protein
MEGVQFQTENSLFLGKGWTNFHGVRARIIHYIVCDCWEGEGQKEIDSHPIELLSPVSIESVR